MTQQATPLASPFATDEVDVCIVGSGAAGSVMAAHLAESGKSVLILEGGPEYALRDLYSSQIWARRLKWSPTIPTVNTAGDHPIGVNFNQGWGTGGSALHHYAVWLRLHEADFRIQSEFGVGLDWPITYDELRPYYDAVQAEVGISGDAEQEVWRPEGDPYPMPPLSLFAQGEILKRGFDAMDIRTSPVPMAINSQRYNGRNACLYDGWCDAGCPIGALANPLVTYLPRASAAGAVLQHNSRALRVLTDGGRATGVEYADSSTGEPRTQRARLVVIAAFAFETPRILLNSADGGLANSSGLVGAYMMAHSTQQVFGMFDEVTEPYYGLPGGQLTGQDAYAWDADRGYLGGWTWQIAPSVKPNDLLGIANTRADLFGQPLVEFIQQGANHLGAIGMIGSNIPSADNRLSLAAAVDDHGLPVSDLVHAFGDDDLKVRDDAVTTAQQVMTAAGATAVWTGPPATQHIMGGVVMGSDPAASVCSSYGQTHDIANLFVAGSSLFPTSGAVNPTFTIHALTTRSAEWINANWEAI